MNTLQLQKFEGVAKVLRIITKIAWICALVITGITLICAVVALLIPEGTVNSLLDFVKDNVNTLQIQIENYSVEVKDFIPAATDLKLLATSGLGMAAFSLAVFAFLAIQLEKVLKNVVARDPFAASSITSLKRLSVGVIVYSIVTFIIGFFMNRMIYDTFLQNTIFAGREVTLNNDFKVSILFTGLLLFLLAKIFEYGASLQHEVDELL